MSEGENERGRHRETPGIFDHIDFVSKAQCLQSLSVARLRLTASSFLGSETAGLRNTGTLAQAWNCTHTHTNTHTNTENKS